MGLLSSIAAVLSEGVGNGMVANAKWGIEEDQQAKKNKAEADSQKNYIDNQKQINKEDNAARSAENKADRESRAKESAADRELQWRIANLRNSSGGGGGMSSKSDALSALKMLDTTITGIDGERARLIGKLDGADAATTKEIQATIANLSSQRENLLNSTDASNIWAANGEVGRAHRAQFFANTEDKKTETSSTIPESLAVPPPSRPDANQSNWSGGDPSLQPQPKKSPAAQNNYSIWDRVSSDVSSLGSGLLNKMNNAYNKPLNR